MTVLFKSPKSSYGIRFAPVVSPLSAGGVSAGDSPQGGIVIPGDGVIPGDDPGDPEPQAGQFRYYCGDVVYDMGTTRLLTDEGYVTFSSDGTPQYHYCLRDHLGNIRVVFDQTGSVEQVNHYYAFGGLMRESTNPGVQPYKYGGKELDRTGGLDAYDFGARSYFADRLQWGTMDPLCEKYYDVTPYGYCLNNPLKFSDPDGKGPWETFLFIKKHPIISLQIGVIHKNGINISSIASRFAGLAYKEEDSNAIRHTLWQAIITKSFGPKIAKEVGDAHEINPDIDLSQRVFSGPDAKIASDQVADLLNNIIGREIGETNGGGVKDMASAVFDHFSKYGLYVNVKNDGDNSYHVILKKIPQRERNGYNAEIHSRDEKGFTKDDILRIKRNNQFEESLKRTL